ncbi:hypothetical protein AB0A73_21960 [Glycomyces sp. NPDC047369]
MTSSIAPLPLIGLAMPQEVPKGPRGLLGQLLAEAQLAEDLEAYRGFSDRVWSMGRVADLLWRHSEAARPLIREALVNELDSAMERRRMPIDEDGGALLIHYFGSVLRPLLDSYPDTAEALQQELQLVRYVAPYRGPDSPEYISEQFNEYVLSWLRADQYRPIVEDCVPDIAAIVFDGSD